MKVIRHEMRMSMLDLKQVEDEEYKARRVQGTRGRRTCQAQQTWNK